MVFVGLVTVAWSRMLRDEAPEAAVRILADDLLVSTGFDDMIDPGVVGSLHSRVVDLTFDFFQGMGSRVALA
eukprot:7262477-Alexandrium_andersonii.AAC.1